ncbi:hypothetical protein [Flavivirga sp. 57AJ16]|nr:hypothetical protein [Flavivirga sp. 57AJ16]MDD7885678.1 hypothetical protein [Flavivirga sp. 57AJ16]
MVKTIRTTLALVLPLSLMCHLSQAQKMFSVHQDNVRPSMIMEYEKIAK